MYTLKIDSEYTHSVSQAQTRKFHSRSLALIRVYGRLQFSLFSQQLHKDGGST